MRLATGISIVFFIVFFISKQKGMLEASILSDDTIKQIYHCIYSWPFLVAECQDVYFMIQQTTLCVCLFCCFTRKKTFYP